MMSGTQPTQTTELIPQEIIGVLEAALEQFPLITYDLGGEECEGVGEGVESFVE